MNHSAVFVTLIVCLFGCCAIIGAGIEGDSNRNHEREMARLALSASAAASAPRPPAPIHEPVP